MICIFLNTENLICQSMDISKFFRGSLQLRDNESRLYFILTILVMVISRMEKMDRQMKRKKEKRRRRKKMLKIL